jgi:hypothetical protein
MSRILGIRPTRTNDEYAVMVRRMLGQQKAPKRRERITPEELCERLYGSLPMVAPSLADPVYAVRDHEGRDL